MFTFIEVMGPSQVQNMQTLFNHKEASGQFLITVTLKCLHQQIDTWDGFTIFHTKKRHISLMFIFSIFVKRLFCYKSVWYTLYFLQIQRKPNSSCQTSQLVMEHAPKFSLEGCKI
jgi:hypothetical protein